MTKPNIVVIGSSNTDMVVRAKKLPLPGESIIGGDFFMNQGGKGANQAVAASRLGGNVTFIGKLGDDVFGHKARQTYENENINCEYLFTDDYVPSGVALISVDQHGQNSIVIAPGSNANLTIEDIDSSIDAIENADIMLIQLETPIDTVEYAIQKSAKKGIRVILNPAPAQKLNEEILKDLYIITPNEVEARLLTGVEVLDETSIDLAASILLKSGVKNVIITLGSKGAYIKNETVSKLVHAPSVVAIDTTAAGDTFNGALTVAIAEGLEINEAVRFANIAASIAVKGLGAQTSIPHRNQVDEQFKKQVVS